MKRIRYKKITEDQNIGSDVEGGNKVYKALGVDLTDLAAKGEIDPVIGRDKELEQVIWILSRKTKNNPVLIGEPGVGKTAAIEKLALAMAGGDAPSFLEGKKLISIDMNAVVMAGALSALVQEVKNDGLVLFMDEIHTLTQATKEALKPPLARGLLSLIGATTLNEYRENIEKDGALERRFQKIMVDEPSFSECVEILNGIKEKYGEFHNVTYTDEAIESFIKLSQRYITDRFLPDKAIDLMDETGAKIRMSRTKNPRVIELEKELLDTLAKVGSYSKSQDYENASLENEKAKEIQQELLNVKNEGGPREEPITITKDLAEEVVAKKTRIPVEKVTQNQKVSLKGLESRLKAVVIGQDEAVEAVTRIIKRTKAGLKDPNRPEGVFLFLGPTGVGKTELVKALAGEVFGDRNKMFRLDMGEFSEPHTVSKLFGSPPGYVGYGEGTQFTEKIRRNPHAIVLLDELEKAHPKVIQSWLQVFEDGHMTDGQGRKVDFKNTIIIMTSNIGAKAGEDTKPTIGFTTKSQSPDDRKIDAVKAELKKSLPPEFLNRIDEIIIFKSLEKDNLYIIIDNELEKIAKKLKERNIELTWGRSVKDLIIKHGYDPEMGARPLRRAIAQYIEDPIANAIIEDEVEDKINLQYDLVKDVLVINGKPIKESKSQKANKIYSLLEMEKDMLKGKKHKNLMTFEAFTFAEPATAPRPAPTPTPDVDPEPPVKPEPPARPGKPITRPSVDPNPIAIKKSSEMDVVKRFLSILKDRNEPIKKYI